jgi:hypothetical protein
MGMTSYITITNFSGAALFYVISFLTVVRRKACHSASYWHKKKVNSKYFIFPRSTHYFRRINTGTWQNNLKVL